MESRQQQQNFPSGLTPSTLLSTNHHGKDTTKLVWDFTTKPDDPEGSVDRDDNNIVGDSSHVRIYLKSPAQTQEEMPKDNETKEVPTVSSSATENNDGDNEKDNPQVGHDQQPQTNSSDNNNEIIEASVLQYQRQLRKSQAAKRAGAVLTPDQLHIVYEDPQIVVVNKPAGVLCVPGIRDKESIANLLFDKLKQEQQEISDEEDPFCPDACSMAVHRLDMDTSGLVVFGKTKTAVSTLHQVFRRESESNNNNNNGKRKKRTRKERYNQNNNTTSIAPTGSVTKEYEALVCGHLPLSIQSGFIDLPLQRDVHHPPFMRVSTPHSEILAREVVDALRERNWTKLNKRNPKPSQTIFRVLERTYLSSSSSEDVNDDGKDNPKKLPVTRLALTPITGRTHQLRVHCATMGYPIVGDPVYGIYGESAFCGGLESNTVEIITTGTSTGTNNDVDETESSSPGSHWRAPVSLQKQIMAVHPPGEKEMCLHAKRLGLPHPTTGEMMEWQVPPTF